MECFCSRAAVRCAGEHRKALAQLCRTVTRPVLAEETRAARRNRATRVEAEDAMARWCEAPLDVTFGVHATFNAAGASAALFPPVVLLHAIEWQLCGPTLGDTVRWQNVSAAATKEHDLLAD